MLNVTLFYKKNSPECDEARALLKELQEQYPHRLAEVDIDSDEAVAAKYGALVPVVEAGPYVAKAPLTKQYLQVTLGAAGDRKNQLEQVGDPFYQMKVKKGQHVGTGDKISYWISKRYLLLLNFFIFLYVGLPILAPALMNAGAETPANIIYRVYKPFCHQFGFRSFFLFGEQYYYPLAEANVEGAKTFEEVTEIPNLGDPYSASRFAAREYVGDEHVGYKMALCERDIAIYLAIFLFGVVFAITGRKIPQLHWLLWLLLGVAPIGMDGFSQLLSQFNWDWLTTFIPYRESTPFLRTFTGAMFGLMTAWFAYPNIESSMNETRQHYVKKTAVKQASQ